MRDPERGDLAKKGDIWDWIPTLIAFLVIYAVLLIFYKPNLLFSLTTTAGGDTGAHHYPAQYLIQELLPHFRLTGWAPGWYAGMPMLTFYFPFPFLLIAILNWILPYQIAFKLVTVLGVFALPAAAYAMGRLWRVRRPFPTLAAVFALAMLFMESYSIYGGNVKSTLAGEFGYMLSFALVFLFLGTMYRGMEKPHFNMLFVLNCLILMVLVLSHIVPTIALVFISPGLLLVNPRWRSFGYLAVVALVGFALVAFWSLPFAANLEWTAHMAWNQLGWKDFLPAALYPVAVLAVVGGAFAVAKRESKLLPLLWISFISAVVYWVLPDGRLWNARIVPFWYFSVHLWAAYGAMWMMRPFTVVVHDLFRWKGITARRVYVPLMALVIGVAVIATSGTAAGWIKWNYSGYEGKPKWPQYQQINNFIATLPPGRVMVEHNQKIDEFGTPRAFEIIPYWTGQPTMEGTLMEASFTAPFHFINQAELSKEASNAIIGVKYPTLDVPNGITHLQLMNIPYFLTCTEEVTTATKADRRAELLATFGDYNVFQIAGNLGVRGGHEESAGAGRHRAERLARYGRRVVREHGRSGYADRLGPGRAGPPAVRLRHARPGGLSAGGADPDRGPRDRRETRERELLVRHHGDRSAPLDKDLVLPQLARGGGRGPLPGVALVHDGHPDPEPRDAHLRADLGQHVRTGTGSHRLDLPGGPVGVADHPVAPSPPAGRGGFGRDPGARLHRSVSRPPGAAI